MKGIRFIKRQLNKSLANHLATLSFLTNRILRTSGGFFLVIILLLLRPFIFFRLGHLYTSRIGHLSYNLDNYLTLQKQRKRKEFALFKTDKYVSNKYLLSMWNRNKYIHISKIWNMGYEFLIKYYPNSPMLISFKDEMHLDISLNSANQVNIKFSDKELWLGRELLKKLGIEYPFICFHNRDSAYLDYYSNLKDGNFHDYRDFEIDDYTKGIKSLIAKKYSTVRLGEIVAKDFIFNDSRFVSVTGNKRTDFLDLFLISESLFFIGGNTGLTYLTTMFRKPCLIVNFIPFKIREMSAISCNSVIVPKKLFSKSQNRFLTISEMASFEYDIHYKGNFYEDSGLIIVNNSETELCAAIAEMEARIKQKWVDNDVQKILQRKLNRSLENQKYWDVIESLGIKISSSFIELNPELI
jgi:putative glycosyltransferase (TIGR04372 family)